MRNAKLIITFNFLWMFIPIVSIFIPFMTSLGFTITDFFKLQSFFGLLMVLAEVPSGYFADLMGRKKSLMLGGLLSGIGFTILFFSKNLLHLYIYEFFIALSLSFISGADYALLFDSLKSEFKNIERKVQAQWTSYFMIASFLGEASAAILAGFLSTLNLNAVLGATSLFGWGPFLISFFLSEPKTEKMSKKNHKENFLLVFKHLFLDSNYLRLLFLNFIIWSLSTMCVVWLIQKYWEENKLPLFYFGLLWAGYSITGAFFNRLAHPIEEKLGTKKALGLCGLLISVGYLLIPHVSFTFGLGLLSIFYIARGIFQPTFKEGFNHRLREEFRATANSIHSLVFRLSFVVAGPLMGIYIEKYNLMSLFTLLGIIFTFFLLVLLLPFLKKTDPHSQHIK